MDAKAAKIIRGILKEYPGRYSVRLRIDVDGGDPDELFRWLLASIFYGAHISSELAEGAFCEFMDRGLDRPKRLLDAGWDRLVEALDAGGYTRYDFKTADKLLEVCGSLRRDYGGDLNALHEAAIDRHDLAGRITALGKGIGEVTVNIFLRELRGIWPKADPELSPLAVQAARRFGLIKTGEPPLDALKRAWGRGIPGKDFRDLEAALVACGIEMRRKKAA